MKQLTLLLVVFILFSCKKEMFEYSKENMIKDEIEFVHSRIMSGTETLYPIERKEISGKNATAISILPEGNKIYYWLLNRNDSVLKAGGFTNAVILPDYKVKGYVFAKLGLKDLPLLSFVSNPTKTYYRYEAFGNAWELNDGWYEWGGRIGNKHLGIGGIGIDLYNIFNRQFGMMSHIRRTPVNPELRGGSYCVINEIKHHFSAVYNSANLTSPFYKLILSKSTDGLVWSEQNLLHKIGTNGGVDETVCTDFNLYGTPVNIPNTQTWYVPWYEFNNLSLYRTNYIYTEDNFTTWKTVNIYSGIQFKPTETSLIYAGGSTMLAYSRHEANAPLLMNVSTDMGTTWSGYKLTNLGSSLGRCMASGINTPEGVLITYADRGTGTVKVSMENNLENIITSSLSHNTPTVIYTCGPADPRQLLGYPSVLRASQQNYVFTLSEEKSATVVDLMWASGRIK